MDVSDFPQESQELSLIKTICDVIRYFTNVSMNLRHLYLYKLKFILCAYYNEGDLKPEVSKIVIIHTTVKITILSFKKLEFPGKVI